MAIGALVFDEDRHGLSGFRRCDRKARARWRIVGGARTHGASRHDVHQSRRRESSRAGRGGVLGGVGLGWLLDHFAHTAPWGVVGGLLIGTGLSIFVAVSTAAKASTKSMERQAPAPSVPDDEDED